MVVAQNRWFTMEKPIKMDDLGAPLFMEISMYWFRPRCSYFSTVVFCYERGYAIDQPAKTYGFLGNCRRSVMNKPPKLEGL